MGKGGCHSWTENCLFGELLSQVTAKLGPCGDPFSGGGCECRVMFLECKEMVGQAKRVSSRLLESCLKLRREDKECVIAHWTHLMEATVEPLEMHFPRESLERKRVFRVSHTKQGRLTREGTEGSFTHTNTHAPTHTHTDTPPPTPPTASSRLWEPPPSPMPQRSLRHRSLPSITHFCSQWSTSPPLRAKALDGQPLSQPAFSPSGLWGEQHSAGRGQQLRPKCLFSETRGVAPSGAALTLPGACTGTVFPLTPRRAGHQQETWELCVKALLHQAWGRPVLEAFLGVRLQGLLPTHPPRRQRPRRRSRVSTSTLRMTRASLRSCPNCFL